jgi:hypothetical protein
MRYTAVNDGLDEHASGVLGAFPSDPSWIGARACVQHMLATVNAFRGRAADARAAYLSYADLRAQTDEDSPVFSRPIYLGAPYVEADLRAVLAAAESGEFSGWGPAELAILHDLLGDALDERARNLAAEAKSDAERGRAAESASARQQSDAARAASRREYQAALTLDPTDAEARHALGQ